jgi:hypothetical protein
MDNKRNFIIANVLVIITLIIAVGLSMNHTKVNITKAEESYLTSLQKRDSLQSTIDSLQLELKIQGDGFDNKELRYEEIIFRYELGIEHIKHYHREAYEEFVRISQFKERYDRETEREFKQRNDLKTIKINEKWN